MNTAITSTPGVCGGDPCLGDTRITVAVIEEHWRLGYDDAGILHNYPGLTQAHLDAARTFVGKARGETDR